MLVPVSDIVGIKNWDDSRQCWIGVICQVMKDKAGKESVQVYDVLTAETQVEIDDLIADSVIDRPWEKSDVGH